VALNEIHDQFWIMFLDPDYDLSVKYPGFLRLHAENLKMPAESKSDFKLLSALGNNYYKRAAEYRKDRRDFYAANYYNGLDHKAIWTGNRPTDFPIMTVFRHFDSASVHRGVLGALPRTLWVIDYPLLERIYYSLVAGFDVYGTAGHQLGTRLYMDAIRVEGESNFLDFMPIDTREETMKSWNIGANLKRIAYVKPIMKTAVHYQTEDPKREFAEKLITEHFPKEMGITFDSVNYLEAGEDYPELPSEYKTIDDVLRAFHASSKPGVSFFTNVASHKVNVAYVRIRNSYGEDTALSVVINRWHDNVTFIFREKKSLDATKDNADFIEGFVGSYPNYFLDVHVDDLPEFFETMQNFDNSPEYIAKLDKFGINRSNKRFWEMYDWFQEKFNQEDPVQAGLFDLNRYYHMAN
jgi:hypothetical protein